MDIRKFLSGAKAPAVKAADVEIASEKPKAMRRNCVVDDDEESEIEKVLPFVDKLSPTEEITKTPGHKATSSQSSSSSKESKTTAEVANDAVPTDEDVTPGLSSAKLDSCDTAVTSLKEKGVSLSAALLDFSDLITWKAGESIPYLALVDTFESISKVGGRLDKESLFCRLFRAVISTTPLELDAIVHLASNSVGPAYEGLELGIGDSLLVKAVCEATGRKKDAVEEDYEKEGDLGNVALLSRNSQKTLSFASKPKPLLAIQVLEMLRAISRTKGTKSQGRKVEIIKGVMVKCQGSEAKFIVRALQGKLRIGTAEQTVLVALAHAFAMSPSPPPAEAAGLEEIADDANVTTTMEVEAEGERSLLTSISLISSHILDYFRLLAT
jgi:DNA ligase N terminus